ncbi:MAG TPA: NUDIX hydrolase [Polyangiaceae bacterium]|nr:NUDIX hydrolase [Polyangiaceae bacterium]
MNPWVVLEDRILVDQHWMRLHEQKVQLANGTTISNFHLLETPSWVAVVPLTEDGEVVMVRQYRHGLGRASLELPAGVIDPGESPSIAAKRELLEETGYCADTLLPLVELSPEPHRSTHRAHFFVAPNVRFSGRSNPDPSEVLEVSLRTKAELVNDALNGGIDHAAHVAAILTAHARGLL